MTWPLLIFIGTVAAWFAYNTAAQAVANVVIYAYAAGLFLGPVTAFALARASGRSAGAALALGLLVPAFWLTKEMIRVSAVFSWGETLYYALSPVSVGILSAAVVPIAVAELVFRRRSTGRWSFVSAAGAVVVGFVILATAAALVGSGSGGNEIFFRYIALYRWIFGTS